MKPIALVSMPCLSGRYPSFQLGLLKPTLERAGISVHTYSLYMYFAQKIGWKINEAIAEYWRGMIGEWLWARAAFGDECDTRNKKYFADHDTAFQDLREHAGCSNKRLAQIRDRDAPEFIDYCGGAIDWSRFGLIGFSLVFQQTVASIAMAKELKRRYPSIPIVFGGASLEDDIAEEILLNCPEVDFVHCGDAELSFPEMVRRLERGESMEGLRGVMWRKDGRIEFAGRAPNFTAMNDTPVPDFDEYFHARKETGYAQWSGAHKLELPVETARGCWWGEKQHCIFCGLNRSGMEFRAKGPEQVVAMLEALSRKYGVFQFNAIDSILAPEYTDKLFRLLAESNSDIQLFYEVRPNLSRQQLGRMQRGGLTSVQPGIESFATNVLKTMRKATTGMRNIELLKWCTYYNILCFYNLLMGFPRETAEDYRLQVRLIDKIVHLQPPVSKGIARPDRGSPMFTDPASQDIVKLKPLDSYAYIYPARFRREHIAYFFEHEMDGCVDDREKESLIKKLSVWQRAWAGARPPSLRYRKAFSSIVIDDRRRGKRVQHDYADDRAALYEYCADARTPRDIAAAFGENAWVGAALDEFLDRDLMLFLDGRYLSLALPENPNFELEPASFVPASQLQQLQVA